MASTSGDESTVDADGDVLRWVVDHIAWLTAGAGLLLGAMKIQRVARLDSATAFGLVTASGPVDVAIGLFVSSVGVFAFLTFLLASLALSVRTSTKGSVGAPLVVLAIALGASVQLLPVLPLALGVLGVLLLLCGAIVGSNPDKDDLDAAEQPEESAQPVTAGNSKSRSMRPYLLLGVGYSMIIWGASLFIDDSVWLLPERLTLVGERPFTGYVVSVDGSWATVLTEDDRRLLVIEVGDLDSRDPCSLGDDSDPSLAAILQGRPEAPEYPDCP